ncbi:substrate-binding domain-containing protein [candidate division KSB1 bacterium]|nr:substrate-binding domain-containing protein [candidate division KSB1 bacterium]
MKMQRITQKQISQVLNLSQVTVSRALRGRPDISVETKEKIVKAAQEMGFYASPKSERKPSRLLGVILPTLDSFYMSVVQGMVRDAEKRGYLLTLGASNDCEKIERRLLKSFLELGVDGIVLSPSVETREVKFLQRIITKGIPIVFCDRIIDQISANSVTMNYENDAYCQAKKLYESGISKIVFLGPIDAPSSSYRRYLGFLKAFKEFDSENDSPLIITLGQIEKCLSRSSEPVAFFCADYKTAMNLDPTSAVVVAPWTSFPFSRNPFPTLVVSILQEMGERTVSILVQDLQNQEKKTTFNHIIMGGENIC